MAQGITTVIMGATQPHHLPALLGGARDVGTTVLPAPKAVRSHKRCDELFMIMPHMDVRLLVCVFATSSTRLHDELHVRTYVECAADVFAMRCTCVRPSCTYIHNELLVNSRRTDRVLIMCTSHPGSSYMRSE